MQKQPLGQGRGRGDHWVSRTCAPFQNGPFLAVSLSTDMAMLTYAVCVKSREKFGDAPHLRSLSLKLRGSDNQFPFVMGSRNGVPRNKGLLFALSKCFPYRKVPQLFSKCL